MSATESGPRVFEPVDQVVRLNIIIIRGGVKKKLFFTFCQRTETAPLPIFVFEPIDKIVRMNIIIVIVEIIVLGKR